MTKWERSTALVTGGCGHIGSFVVRRLLQRKTSRVVIVDNLSAYPFDQVSHFCGDFIGDDRVSLVKADIVDRESLRGHLGGVDYVFHLAAYADVAATIYNPDRDFEVNVVGTYNVLRASLDAGVKKLVFASSAAVYGNQEPPGEGVPPIFHEDMKPNPLSTYANSKLWGEYEARLFYSLYGLPTVSLRYFSIYGPLQVPKPKSHSWVIAIFLMRAVKGRPLIIYGGGQVRDFIHVDDVAEATVRAAEAGTGKGDVVNIGTGIPTRIDDLAEKVKTLVKEKTGIDVEVRYGPRPKGDPLGGYADTRRMKELLGLTPRSLDEGLRETLDWILANINVIPEYVLF